jgi:3-carboxy-cis,cis-muconate cycloisomerase
MRENLERTGGVLLAERVTSALVADVGRLAAHDAVTECCRRALAGEGDLADLLAEDPLVGGHLRHAEIERLLDPAGYLGSAGVFIERALAAHRERKENA